MNRLGNVRTIREQYYDVEYDPEGVFGGRLIGMTVKYTLAFGNFPLGMRIRGEKDGKLYEVVPGDGIVIQGYRAEQTLKEV